MSNQDNAKNKSHSFKSIVILILVVIVVIAAKEAIGDLELFSFTKKLDDYASAGAYMKEQLMNEKRTFSFVIHTTEYNPIIGGDPILYGVKKEAVAHTGDPTIGDHLAMRVWGFGDSTNYTVTKKEDKSHDVLMNYEPIYSTTKSQEEELAKKADEILTSLHLNGLSDYDKVFAIYKYICDNVTYDYTNLEDDTYVLKSSAYAAAINGTAVCSGIADLFYYLANLAGLDTRITTNDNHAWNFVRVDGEYYFADATWDIGKSPDQYEYFLYGYYKNVKSHGVDFTFGPKGLADILKNSHLDYGISMSNYGEGVLQ